MLKLYPPISREGCSTMVVDASDNARPRRLTSFHINQRVLTRKKGNSHAV
jgi:hypothetical protein